MNFHEIVNYGEVDSIRKTKLSALIQQMAENDKYPNEKVTYESPTRIIRG